MLIDSRGAPHTRETRYRRRYLRLPTHATIIIIINTRARRSEAARRGVTKYVRPKTSFFQFN